MDAINDNLNKNDEVRTRLGEMLSEKEVLNNTRTRFISAYLDISLEHQEALLLLIRSKLYGSAVVLVRPIFDTLCRALWVCRCASTKEIEEMLLNDNFEFPKNMITVIDQQYTGDKFYSRIKEEAWGTMSSYVHSGLLPVSRRFTGSMVQPNYEDRELIEIMRCATMSILLLSLLFFKNTGLYEEAKKTEKMIMSYG